MTISVKVLAWTVMTRIHKACTLDDLGYYHRTHPYLSLYLWASFTRPSSFPAINLTLYTCFWPTGRQRADFDTLESTRVATSLDFSSGAQSATSARLFSYAYLIGSVEHVH